MSSFGLQRLPFLLHSVIELTPSIVFIINPASQLYVTSAISDSAQLKPGAEAIIRQYGVLLLVSILISTTFAVRKVDRISRQVAAALTVYHLAPTVRATLRLWGGETHWRPDDMGGPWVHLLVHVVCLVALGSLSLRGNGDQQEIEVWTKSD